MKGSFLKRPIDDEARGFRFSVRIFANQGGCVREAEVPGRRLPAALARCRTNQSEITQNYGRKSYARSLDTVSFTFPVSQCQSTTLQTGASGPDSADRYRPSAVRLGERASNAPAAVVATKGSLSSRRMARTDSTSGPIATANPAVACTRRRASSSARPSRST